jgi:hypothetical protein
MVRIPFSCLTLACLILGGCSSSDSPAPAAGGAVRSGTVTVSIAWPEGAGRSFPAKTQSIKVQLVSNYPALFADQEQIITFPTTTCTFEKVMAFDWILRATAYEGTGGAGRVLASGETTIHVLPAVAQSVGLTIDTLDHVTLNQASLTVKAGTGDFLTLSPFDARENLLLLPESAMTWRSSALAVATVGATGSSVRVSELKAGTTIITATADGVTREATATVTVVDDFPPTVSLTAEPATIERGQSTTLYGPSLYGRYADV